MVSLFTGIVVWWELEPLVYANLLAVSNACFGSVLDYVSESHFARSGAQLPVARQAAVVHPFELACIASLAAL